MTTAPPLPVSRRRWRTRLKRTAFAGGVLAIAWLLASYFVACRLSGRPHPPRAEPVPKIAWGVVTAFRLDAGDGEQVGAWFVGGRPDKPPVLLLHGNGGCRSDCLNEAELAAAAGHSVLLLTLRAHGDSTGEHNDFGFSARREVIAAVMWLESRFPRRPPVVWGRSLGAAAAVFAAEELGDRIAGYLLECPYRDLRTAVRNRTHCHLPPVVEFVAYAGLRVTAPLTQPNFDRISPAEAAAGIPPSSRVLILAGGADRRATPDDARAIQEQCRGPTELRMFPNGDHLQLAGADPAGYREAVVGFLSRCGGR